MAPKTRDSKKRVDILNGPLVPSFIYYALPLIFASMLQILYNAADVAIVGNLSTRADVASVGATTVVINLLVVAFVNIGGGVNVTSARAFGAGDGERLKRIVSTSYAFSLILGVAVAALGQILTVPLLRLTECPENVFDGAVLYMRIYFLGTPASLFYNFLSGIVRTGGDSKRPFLYLAISGAVNVVLNIVLILLTGKAVVSVAIATVTSMYVSAALLFIHLVRSKGAEKLSPFNFKMHGDELAKIIKYGIPTAISAVCFSISNIFIQSEINSFGDVGISGNTAASTVEGFVFSITQTALVTTSVFVGQNLGAGRRERVGEILKKSYLLWGAIAGAVSVFCLLFGKTVLGLIIPGETEAINFGIYRAYLICGAAVIHALYNINNGAMQAFGYSIYQMIVNIGCICGFRIVWMIFVYPHAPTPFMLYVAYPISFALVLLVNSVFVGSLMKRLKKGDDFGL